MIKVIKISGMHCMHCVGAVKNALEELTGITKVDVSLEAGQATIEATDITDAALQEAIEDIGFDVVEIQ